MSPRCSSGISEMRHRRTLTPMLAPYGSYSTRLSRWVKPVALVLLAILSAFYGALYALFFPFLILQFAIPLLILALLVIWVLPESKSAPTELLAKLFFAFLVGAILWPDYIALALPGLPWITMRRIIAVPLLLVLLISISTSPRVRQEMKEVLGAAPVVWKLVVALVGIQLISIALSRDPGFSTEKFIVAQLYWITIFFAGCYVLRKPGRVALWCAILCLMMIPLALSGLNEWMNSRVFWAGRIPSFLVIEDEAILRILSGASRAATGLYRVQTTFTTSLGYAEYMALTVPFLVHYALGPFRLPIRLAGLAALPATFFMIVLTDSRLGMVGFFLSFLFYLLIRGALRWRSSRESLFGPAIVLSYPVVFGAFVAATFFVGRLRRMVWGGGEHQFSTDARSEQYRMGLDLLASNPLGYGIGRGADTLGYTNLAGAITIDTYYILIALEYGAIGFLVYYGMFLIGIFKGGTQLLRTGETPGEHLYLVPLIIALSNFIVIKSIFSQESNHPIAFMMLAMVLALLARGKKAEEAARETSRLSSDPVRHPALVS